MKDDNLGAVALLVVIGLVVSLSGCATERPSRLGTMSKWHTNCANAAIERQLYTKNIILLEQQGIGNKDDDPVRREKIAILNELILESDMLCGPNGLYSQPQHS